jgi:hypothetical protein
MKPKFIVKIQVLSFYALKSIERLVPVFYEAFRLQVGVDMIRVYLSVSKVRF